MWRDPVVEEVRAIRDAYSKRFDYDLHAMAEDLRKKEGRGDRKLVDPEPRKPAGPGRYGEGRGT